MITTQNNITYMTSKASTARKKMRAAKKKAIKDKESEALKRQAKELSVKYGLTHAEAMAYAKSEDRRKRLKEGSRKAFKGTNESGKAFGRVAGKGLKSFGKYLVEVKKYELEQKQKRQRK